MNSYLLKSKTALITGCSRGIGKSILEKFAENGANCIACIRKPNAEFENYCKNLSKKNNVKITKIGKIIEKKGLYLDGKKINIINKSFQYIF